MLDLLIADDEVWVARMISSLIDWEAEGFRIVGMCHDGLETMQRIRELQPALVLTDIKMPGMTGLEIIQRSSAEGLDVSFIIISGYCDFEYAKTAITYGAAGYLLKPLDQKELLDIVARTRATILQARQTRQDQQHIADTLDRTLEQARLHFFVRLFETEHEALAPLETLNSDLRTTFGEGLFQVAALTTANAHELPMVIEAASAALDAALPDCLDRCIFINRQCIDLVLNYHAENQKQVISAVYAAFQQLLTRSHCPVSMALGTPVERLCNLRRSYQTAHEALAYRWVQGKNQLFENQIAVEDESALTSICSMNSELKLRSAFKEGNLPLVIRQMDELLAHAGQWAEKNPRILVHSVQWLAALCEDVARLSGAAHDELREKIDGCSTLDNVKATLMEYSKQLIALRNQEASLSKNQALAQEALRYIDQNFMQDISLNDVAEAVHLNPNYFCTLFKDETHTTFKEYLTQKRIDTAKKFLKSEKFHLNEIADMIGYNDVKHFSHMFKKIVGVTPSEYRRIVVGHE